MIKLIIEQSTHLNRGTGKVALASSWSDRLLCLQVPITLYFMTHAYFCFYHALSNVVLRRTLHAVQSYHTILQWLLLALVIFILAYITALMETVTIAHFPYYRFKVTTPLDSCQQPATYLSTNAADHCRRTLNDMSSTTCCNVTTLSDDTTGTQLRKASGKCDLGCYQLCSHWGRGWCDVSTPVMPCAGPVKDVHMGLSVLCYIFLGQLSSLLRHG
jgi:hypothetical protein